MEKELRILLRMEEVKNMSEIKTRFKEIANILFKDFHIEKGDVRYDFLEVEFYFFSKEHPDFITYPRNTKAGEWFFHISGVDISFESKKEKREGKEIAIFGGGILVRSILKEGQKVIAGPYKCVDELFDKFDAFSTNLENFPILKPNEQKVMEIESCIRWIPPFTGKPDEAKKARKEEELSEKYGEDFGNTKDVFEKLITEEKYRYYRADYDNFKQVKSYSANPFNSMKIIGK